MAEYRLELRDEKYTVVLNDGCDGKKFNFEALRYNDPWRNLCGDNLVLALVQHIRDQEDKVKELEAQLKVIYGGSK